VSRCRSAAGAPPAKVAAVVLAALCAGVGCGVPFGAPSSQEAENTCNTDRDCAADGAACAQGRCAATRYDLGGLRLEVHPNAGASFGANTSFMVDPAALGVSLTSPAQGAAPFLANAAVALPQAISIRSGKVLLDASAQCPAAAQGAPANVTFYRIAPFTGILFPPVTVTASGVEPSFDADLVPDQYDVYIVPLPIAGCNGSGAAPFPPVFLPNRTIDAGGGVVFRLPPIGVLGGTITGLEQPKSWTVDVVEHSRGLPISSPGTLTTAMDITTVSAQISSWDTTLQPILRLIPNDPSSPTVYWDLDGAVFTSTATEPIVSFAVDGLAVNGVRVTGQILDPEGKTGIPSQLTFQSTRLYGSDGGNAAFSLNAATGAVTGAFTIPMPRGDYTMRAVPVADDELSVTSFPFNWPASWSNADTCVCNQKFKLEPRASLEGMVKTATGQPLAGTFVGVAPSLTAARDYLADTHALDPLSTRAASSTTDDSGQFSLLVDVGSSDLSVQPDPSTSLPWLVRTQLAISGDVGFSTLTLTTPAFLGGTVVDPSGMPVVDATINAWFPIRDPSAPGGVTGAAVQIATASTDGSGAFTLVLPSSI
jgi:hypothetical protein